MKKIPYGKQDISELDVEAVAAILRSDWLTTGPSVAEFEQIVADFTGASEGVAVSSGTAALHCAMYAIGIESGDEVIVPAMTFAATANAVVFQGGTPVFADVDGDTLLIDPKHVESLVSSRTKAIIAVDYAGQACDYHSLQKIADQHGIILVSDGCHSLGGDYHGLKVGSLAEITIFSFHPVKPITTGEGGMAVTNNKEYASRMRIFRSHGITSDFREREEKGSWYYEMVDLGFNYRITDFQCALGISQMKRLADFLSRRQEIAAIYAKAFSTDKVISPLRLVEGVGHAWHLYVVRLLGHPSLRRDVFKEMREAGIGVNVHYIPVHLHPFYRHRFNYDPGLCPVAEQVYQQILSLPMWPGMSNADVDRVISVLTNIVEQQVKVKSV